MFITSSIPALAQVHLGKSWTNSLEVTVINNTADRSAIIVHHDKGNLILGHGEHMRFSLGGGIGLGRSYSRVDLQVTFCKGGIVESHFVPPAWSTDHELLGSAALPETFSKNTSKKDLKDRVNEIKKQIKKRDLLGRKRLERELDNWFKVAERSGPGVTTASCVPAIVKSEAFNVPYYYAGYGMNQRESVTLSASGSGESRHLARR